MSTEHVWISSASASTKIPPPDLPILPRGSISWRKKPPCRRRLSQNLPMSWRGSINWRRRSPSRLRRPLKLLVSRQGSTSWRREPPSRAQVRSTPSPPAAPKQSSLVARAEPSAPNETARSDNPGPLLRDYSVEDARDGIAVVDSRDGPQEVAPGDFIPGAGRVLRTIAT